MVDVDTHIEKILEALRRKMRERGFSQLQVQQELGWGRSYVSQLFTGQKGLRFDQVLMILDVIGIEAAQFFAETYGYHVISTIPGDLDPSSLRSVHPTPVHRALEPVQLQVARPSAKKPPRTGES